MNSAITGQCLCGAFRFEVDGPLGEVHLCHCDQCRRANGTSFSANARVPIENHRVITGIDVINEYESSPGAWRAFCSRCGSPVFARAEQDPLHIRIRLGTLARDAQAKITGHVWVGSKANWDLLAWDVPRYLRDTDGPLVDP
jgi:hypothetical protein